MSARALLQRTTGLELNDAIVERAVAERMAQLGVDTSEAYLRRMSASELSALTELVVVPESWMFRDPEAFFTAAQRVGALLLANPQRLVRILSVPCAGGEEPYSMAMALHDAGVPPNAYSIDAIDLSEVALARARQGRYTRNAFRGDKLEFRERHFQRAGAEFQIDPTLRAQVNFSQGNLLTLDVLANAGRYDVIFCRNLLIYFDAPTTAAAINRLHALLSDDGLLLAGYAEVPAFCSNGFAALRSPGAFALCKRSAQPGVPPRLWPDSAQRQHAAPRSPEPPAPRPVTSPTARPVPHPLLPTAPRAALAPAPAPGPEQLAQARKLADGGHYAAATLACQKVLEGEPDAVDAYFLLGLLSERAGQAALAEQHWRRCVYLQPDHYDALCHLALLAGQNGNPEQAAAFQQRAARLFQRRQDGANVRLKR
jgi:chemotaxis protein methyltransferase WspC